MEIDGESLENVTHGDAVSMFIKAKERRSEYVQLKVVKGALSKNRKESKMSLVVSCVSLVSLLGLGYLAYKYELTGKAKDIIMSRRIK